MKEQQTQTPLSAIKVKNVGNNDLRVAGVLAAGRLGDKLGYAGFGNVAALADRMAALVRWSGLGSSGVGADSVVLVNAFVRRARTVLTCPPRGVVRTLSGAGG